MQPQRIGRYEVVREVGRGAMGVVYLAHDPAIDRSVAIKTVSFEKGLSDRDRAEAHQRFLREAQAAGRLIHPHIVTILDVGESQDGDLFIAMEYIEGPTLDRFANPAELLEGERVLHFICQAGEALAFAHRHRIVHRDLKPANLMVADGDRLKVTDFGLAKDPGTELTHSGTLIGTPSYMSPEQIAGKPLDGRSDLFSLGVVLFELLTGAKPFPGDSISTVIYRILHEEPAVPSDVNPRVPVELDGILRKALHKDPGLRFQSGSEMARAIRDFPSAPVLPSAETTRVSREAVTVAAPTPRRSHGPTARPPARRGSAVKSLVLSLVAALLVVVALVAFVPKFRRAMRRAVAPSLLAGAPLRGSTDPGEWLPLTADRSGVAFRLDGKPIASDRLVRDASLVGSVVSASDGCLWGETPITEPFRAEALHVNLTDPVMSPISFASVPDGAEIAVDGEPTGEVTPAQIPLEACVRHSVSFSKVGHAPAALDLPADGDWLALSSEPVPLQPLPDGSLRVEADYLLHIFEDGVRLGTSGQNLSLPAGPHELMLGSRRHRVRLTREVEIEPGGETVLWPELPPLGVVRINALPGNATVVVDGIEAGPPPVELSLAAGAHQIVCRWHVGRPRAATRQVVVQAGGSNEPVNFRQGR